MARLSDGGAGIVACIGCEKVREYFVFWVQWSADITGTRKSFIPSQMYIVVELVVSHLCTQSRTATEIDRLLFLHKHPRYAHPSFAQLACGMASSVLYLTRSLKIFGINEHTAKQVETDVDASKPFVSDCV